MTTPEWTDLAKALAPAIAGIASLVHPLAARARRRRREQKLREMIDEAVAAAVKPFAETIAVVEIRLAALEGAQRPEEAAARPAVQRPRAVE